MMFVGGGVMVCALSSLLLVGTLAAAQDNVASILTKPLFEQMLKHRNDAVCPGRGLFTYEGFIEDAESFTAFGTTGEIDTRKREIAAFLAQTSHQTTGGWASAPDEPYAWGFCNPPNGYFFKSQHNYNYGQTENAILRAKSDDRVVSFENAFQFWMDNPHFPIHYPSPHDVMTGKWTPSAADIAAGRAPGYGVVTNIINGEVECGKGSNPEMEDSIGFYQRYCDILGVGYGNNLDCANQSPFE